MTDTIVMLFHSRDAATQFCSDLQTRNFSANDCQMIGPEDMPQYGRGEHAVMDRPAHGGILDTLSSFFGFDTSKGGKYNNLPDFLENQGLSRDDANYYESEVRGGSTMLLVKAGKRADEIRALAGHGTGSRIDYDRDAGFRDTDVKTSDMATPDIDRESRLRDTADIDRESGLRDTADIDREGGHMELRKEVPEVEKHEVERGEATISKHAVTENVPVDVPKRREELVIERQPAEGRETSGDVGDDESISIPLMEEEVSVSKRPSVSEEVDISKREITDVEQENIPVQREELDLEDDTSITEEERDRRYRDRYRDRPAA